MCSIAEKAEYVASNEPYEWDRLDFQHQILVRMFGGLHRAPIDNSKIKRVLDIGCGTGRWTIDFANKHPHAEVLGFDIVHKPWWSDAPSNCKLSIADLELDETWEQLGSFDFIHGRFITPSVRDWPRLLARCHMHLNSRGFLEFQELAFPLGCLDDSYRHRSNPMIQWGENAFKAWTKAGIEPREDLLMPEQLTKQGFEDIELEDFRMYIGPWAPDAEGQQIGLMGQQNFFQGLPGIIETLFIKYLGWERNKFDTFTEELKEEVTQPKLRCWLPVWTCYAEKRH